MNGTNELKRGPGRPRMHGTKALKRAVSTLGRRAIDRRTTVGKALAAWRAELIADLGGIEQVSLVGSFSLRHALEWKRGGEVELAQGSDGTASKRGPGRPFVKGHSGNPGGCPKGLVRAIREQTRNGEQLVDFMLRVFRGEMDGLRASSSPH
jgi:hypothetical protein